MVNCNPETVSTDYDTSDRLYFEPLTFEDVLNIIENEKPKGVVVQFGGQTPLKIAERLHAAGVPILGTSQDAIDLAEDRERFGDVLKQLKLKAPPFGTVRNEEEALAVAERIGYPVLVRPSYVLGGRAMEIVYDNESLERYLRTAVKASPRHPVLIDRFLEHSIEIDVDAICDGEDVYIGAVMQHVEEAGIHSGDSACVIPHGLAGRRRGAADRGADGGSGAGAGRRRPHERAVRGAAERSRRREHLRARGQPEGQPHGALCQQSHGGVTGPHGHPGDRRTQAARHGSARLGGVHGRRPGPVPQGSAACGRQRSCPALPALSRRRHDPRTGDEVHRRGHGRGHEFPRRLRESFPGGRRPASPRRARSSSPSPTPRRTPSS